MARYKRKRVEESPERQIALGAVVSSDFLREVQAIYQPELLETPFIATILGWCMDYYGQFQSAPGVHIEDVYKTEVQEGNLSEEDEDMIGTLLDSLSDEYERSSQFNYRYILDQAERYFETRNLMRRTANIRTSLSRGDLEAAQVEMSQYKTISMPRSGGVDPFTDRDGMREAFEHASDPIFTLPGEVGRFLNGLFVRDAFVTLLGPEKRGKTWLLIELSMWARRAGLNVAFFSAGDMTLPQLQLRYGTRFAGRSPKSKFCGQIAVPVVDCLHNQGDTCEDPNRAGTHGIIDSEGNLKTFEQEPDYIPCTYCRNHPDPPAQWRGASWFRTREKVQPLTWNEAADAGERLHRRWGKKSRLKVDAYANETLSVQRMEAQLNLWASQENFHPDVIITDYMDLLIDESSEEQYRHRINRIWGGMRRLSQERHCLAISASQSDSASYEAKWLGMKHFSESKTKNAHVTGMITMNQTMEEKRRGQMRLGQLLTREDEFDERKAVTILQSLAMGKPLLDSF